MKTETLITMSLQLSPRSVLLKKTLMRIDFIFTENLEKWWMFVWTQEWNANLVKSHSTWRSKTAPQTQCWHSRKLVTMIWRCCGLRKRLKITWSKLYPNSAIKRKTWKLHYILRQESAPKLQEFIHRVNLQNHLSEHDRQLYSKILLSSFHLNGTTYGF